MTGDVIPVPAAAPGHVYRRIEVDRYGGACGAVVSGVDLAAPLDADTVAEVRRALLDHGVIFLRDQAIDADQQVAFSRWFGPYSPVPFIEPTPEHPEVIAVVREASETQRFTFGSLWHSDFSFLPEPPMGSILYAQQTPPYGGDTIWADQRLAFAALSPGMREMLRPLRAQHSARNGYAPTMQAIHDRFTGMTVKTSDEALRVEVHPVVRVHGETGEESLFVNAQYTVGLEGFMPHEADPLLQWLYAHATQASFTCRWHWAPGDLAFWDNRRLQHMAMADFSGHRRQMRRTTVAGERPLAPR